MGESLSKRSTDLGERVAGAGGGYALIGGSAALAAWVVLRVVARFRPGIL